MTFYPRKNERYLCALRNFLQRKISANGFLPQYSKMLKKIYLCEAVLYADENVGAYDLLSVTDCIFGAAVLKFLKKGKTVTSTLSGNGEFSVNLRLYEMTVCELLSFAQNGSAVRFLAVNRGVVITLSMACQKPVINTLRFLGADLYRLLPNNEFAVFIPLSRDRCELKNKSETEYLYDRYSVLNVFLD